MGKKADAVPAYKKRDHQYVKKDRPISLVPVFRKMF